MASNDQNKYVTTPILICVTVGLVAMLGAITLNLIIGRNPDVLVNFCTLIIVNVVGLITVSRQLHKQSDAIDNTSNTVEDLANGLGQRKIEAAVHKAFADYREQVTRQPSIDHPSREDESSDA